MLDFKLLCMQAFSHLGTVVAEEIADGEVVQISGIDTQILFDEDHALVYYEIGTPYPNVELQVYRQLLELQMAFVDSLDARFVRDAFGDRLLFIVRLNVEEDTTSGAFASIVTDLAKQVALWHDGLLTGLIIETRHFESEDENTAEPALLA